MATIWKKIKDARKIYNLTQKELAKKTWVNINTIFKIEQDKIINPTMDTLQLLSDWLGIDYWNWFEWERNIKIKNSYISISDENFKDLLDVASKLKDEEDLLWIKIWWIEILCSDSIDNYTALFIDKKSGKENWRMLV